MKKFRDAEGRFVIEGERLVADAFEAGAELECVIITQNREDHFAALRARLGVSHIRVRTATETLLGKITETRQPQGIAAVARIPEIDIRKALDAVPADLPVTVLWGVTDPGNFGTVIRTADWFGSRGLLFSRGSADPFNAKTVRGTMGSIFRVRLGEIPDADDLLALARDSGRELVAAVAGSDRTVPDRRAAVLSEHPPEARPPEARPPEARPPAPLLVLGSEAHGLPAALLDRIPRRISIPGGGAESLNLAVAHGILLASLSGAAPLGNR